MKEILYSVLTNRCPACHGEHVFKHRFYKLKHFSEMNTSCSCCRTKYEKEPGFFYGAMYVSYALMVGWFVITWVVNSFLIQAGPWPYLIFLLSTITIFSPLTFRVSRLVWLNFFIRYTPAKRDTFKNISYETTFNK